MISNALSDLPRSDEGASRCLVLICTAKAAHEPLVTSDVLDGLSSQLVQQMLLANYPLSGMEIRFLRKALGLTQQALADVLGVFRETVARWEALEEDTVDMPLSIAIRTVLAASNKSPLSHAEESHYHKPPGDEAEEPRARSSARVCQ